MKGFFTKHKIVIAIISVLLSLITIPIVINFIYLSGYKNNTPPNTMFKASDLLVYFGAIISAIGTTALGVVAYKLNKKVLALTEADEERNKLSMILLEGITKADTPWTPAIEGYNSVYHQINRLSYNSINDICFVLHNIGPAILSRVIIHYRNNANQFCAELDYSCSLSPNARKNVQLPWIQGCSQDCLNF